MANLRTFTIELQRDTLDYTTVELEAETVEQAEHAAIILAREGNVQDWELEDEQIVVLDVESVPGTFEVTGSVTFMVSFTVEDAADADAARELVDDALAGAGLHISLEADVGDTYPSDWSVDDVQLLDA